MLGETRGGPLRSGVGDRRRGHYEGGVRCSARSARAPTVRACLDNSIVLGLTARKAAETMVLGETRGAPLRSSLTPDAFLTALSSCPLYRLVPCDPAIAALRKGM